MLEKMNCLKNVVQAWKISFFSPWCLKDNQWLCWMQRVVGACVSVSQRKVAAVSLSQLLQLEWQNDTILIAFIWCFISLMSPESKNTEWMSLHSCSGGSWKRLGPWGLMPRRKASLGRQTDLSINEPWLAHSQQDEGQTITRGSQI